MVFIVVVVFVVVFVDFGLCFFEFVFSFGVCFFVFGDGGGDLCFVNVFDVDVGKDVSFVLVVFQNGQK